MWKSIGHFFASVLQKSLAIDKAVIATAPVVEGVTSLVPVYGPLALTIEKAAYAVLGEIAAAISAGGDAATAHLTNAGMDQKVIDTVKAVVAGSVKLEDVAKALPGKP